MDPDAAFDELTESMVALGAERAKMMGRPMLRIGRRMFACLDRGVLGLRLGAGTDEHELALALEGAAIFTPAGAIVFRDWVALPVDQAEHWEEWSAAALRYTAENVLPR